MSGLEKYTRFKLFDCIFDTIDVLKHVPLILKELLTLQFTGAVLEIVNSVQDVAVMLNDCGINFNFNKMQKAVSEMKVDGSQTQYQQA